MNKTFVVINHIFMARSYDNCQVVLSIFIMVHPVIIKWGDYSMFDIPAITDYLSEQLWNRMLSVQ